MSRTWICVQCHVSLRPSTMTPHIDDTASNSDAVNSSTRQREVAGLFARTIIWGDDRNFINRGMVIRSS